MRVRLDGDVGGSQLGNHRIQVRDAKVDHPGFAAVAKARGVCWKRSEGGGPGLLLPDWVAIVGGHHVHAEVVAILPGRTLGVRRAKEHATDAVHSFHAVRLHKMSLAEKPRRLSVQSVGQMAERRG